MRHQMKLQQSPFEKIKEGIKTIEIRLNDEKRQLLQIGDEIEFTSLQNPKQTVVTEILELLPFSSFQELFSQLPSNEYGGGASSDMYNYYTKDDESRFGVLGIKLRRK